MSIKKQVKKIISLEPEMQKYSDQELCEYSERLMERVKEGEKKEKFLIESYALVREATYRVLGLKLYPVQIQGALELNKGHMIEMLTGQGKTIVTTMPAYLNALDGKGVHVITVNDYLARRDATEIGQVFDFLGMSVGCVLESMYPGDRKEQYAKDVTYVTNSELGFDFLRDNLVHEPEQRVLRDLNYCIVDEADSILIDEAKTPLIIANQIEESSKLYTASNALAKKLIRGKDLPEVSRNDFILGNVPEETGDFIVDEKHKTVYLTKEGLEKVENAFRIQNYSNPKNLLIQHAMQMSLKAHYIMKRDQDYIVKDGKVVIVDEFTGRTQEDRRYSDGLHQAIEAKEQVEVQDENITSATITYQNLFRKYKKLSGMTGTIMTEKKEIRDIYHVKSKRIPTIQPVIREDREDIVYVTKDEKYEAVLHEIQKVHKTGQPILVGTANIDVSEDISKILSTHHIPHQILNAKSHEKEAEIVAKAGQFGMITIATNMAGRGTDIKLDDKSREVGGLKIIGTERHESRRIDNQLRGRSGRQGDPGNSQFFLSLDDRVLRLYHVNNIQKMLQKSGLKVGEPINNRSVHRLTKKAQKNIEIQNFNTRKNVFKYDRVMDEQRGIMFELRDQIVHGAYQYLDPNMKKKQKNILNYELNIEEKELMLSTIDYYWELHILDMERLKETVQLQGYGQRDPVVEYELLSYHKFEHFIKKVNEIFYTEIILKEGDTSAEVS